MNKISIITINRNNAKGLEQTIKSVLEQTYSNYEYIIIDGASDDESIDIIKKHNTKISHWISEKDTGIFNAMNKGIVKSTGDYCYFLNSGDSFTRANTLHEIFENKEYQAPFINGHQLNIINGEKHRVVSPNRTLTLFDFYWGTIKHQATFIRRDLFSTYGLYDENLKITADWKFFLQTIGLHNEQPVFVDTDIVNFEWEGISTNPKWIKIHDEERKQVIDQCIPKSIQADYEQFHTMSNYKYIITKIQYNKLYAFLVKVFAKVLR